MSLEEDILFENICRLVNIPSGRNASTVISSTLIFLPLQNNSTSVSMNLGTAFNCMLSMSLLNTKPFVVSEDGFSFHLRQQIHHVEYIEALEH
ncbi:MAG: hypothetical protein H0U95_13790 [Bacteroidetes bacterium]|nr:hypothetical protein [Bacteroidota bacterium]